MSETPSNQKPWTNYITVPELCNTHQILLFTQAKYGKDDPWQALLVTTMLALFQSITVHNASYKKINYDIKNLSELGCLACERPDAFGEIVEAAKSHNLGDIKRLGDRWLAEKEYEMKENKMNINEMSEEIYQQNVKVGWWDDPNRCIYQTLQLVSTEIAEATEGERKGLMDDHLPTRHMGEVELADALIRTLDLGGRFDLKYDEDVEPHIWCIEEDSSIGKQHLGLNMCVVNLGVAFEIQHSAGVDQNSEIVMFYSKLVSSILHVAFRNGYDIDGATREKHLYNKTRADHKRENREKEGGKTF